jgi:hypothetical protein
MSGLPPTAERYVDPQEIVTWLATSLGDVKAKEVVDGGLAALRLPSRALTDPQVHAVLDHLAQEPGIVGMTAMLAKSRLHFLQAALRLERPAQERSA